MKNANKLEFHENNFQSLMKDPDMIDAATRENGRINNLREEISKLESEMASLRAQ